MRTRIELRKTTHHRIDTGERDPMYRHDPSSPDCPPEILERYNQVIQRDAGYRIAQKYRRRPF